LAKGGDFAGFEQLVGDVTEGADDHNRLVPKALLHDLDHAANGGGIFDGRASKFQHAGLLSWFEGLFTNCVIHCTSPVSKTFPGRKKQDPPAVCFRFWRWVLLPF